MPYTCDVCGRSDFKTPAALGSHKRSFNCSSEASFQQDAEPPQKKGKVLDEAGPADGREGRRAGAAAVGADQPLADDGQQRMEVPADMIVQEIGEGAGPSGQDHVGGDRAQPSAAGGSYFSDPVENPEASRFPEMNNEVRETLKLVEFIRHCRNNVGLSQEDTRSLIDLLFYKDFDLSKVKVRTPQDIKKFEEKVLFSQDDVSQCCLTASL